MRGDLRVSRGPDGDQVRGVGRDLRRPCDALFVVVRLDDAGHVAPDADPVAAHHDWVSLAVLAEVHGPDGDREIGAQLEDVADLDPLAQGECAVAIGAWVSLAGVHHISHHIGREVAPHVHVAQVEPFAIGAGHQVG